MLKTWRHEVYISSLAMDAPAFNRLVRSHWNVENQLHWALDVVFGEDQSRKRIRNAAQNFSTVRKMTLNLLKAKTEKISVNRKRNKCALSDQYREKNLGFDAFALGRVRLPGRTGQPDGACRSGRVKNISRPGKRPIGRHLACAVGKCRCSDSGC
ncbi:MAG: ISAs1 family transposase [Saprospiraceae bacterium]|nr:ISAs1 family transposase [Saprospiraceae bacterium]